MNAQKELEMLMNRYTTIVEDGFVIDIRNHEYFDYVLKEMGVKKGYREMANLACDLYEKKMGEPFLFSNKCVAYEIEYHTDAYMTMMGYRGYIRNITTFLLNKAILVRACEDINISTNDVYNLQSIMFQYYRGIRSCYKNTDKDPYKKFRLGK